MSATQTDPEPPALFAAREPIFPRRVSGRFRPLKWRILGVTLGIYFIFPWLRWDRRPTTTHDDIALTLVPTPTGYAAQAALASGLGRVEVAADGTAFRQSRDIMVP